MNQEEQKSHRTKTQELGRGLMTVEKDLAAMVEFVETATKTLQNHETIMLVDLPEQMRTAVGEERTHRLKLADEQRAYVDSENRRLNIYVEAYHDKFCAHMERGFWGRLKWLLFGR